MTLRLQGPERLYNLLIHPLFVAAEPQVDVVVDELTRVQALAKDAITAIKQADTDTLTERAADIAGVIAEDGKELMDTMKSEAKEAVDTVHTKAAQLGWLWWKEGIVGVIEEAVTKMERARDELIERVPEVVAQLKQRWQAQEALISKRTPHELNPEEEEEKPAGKKGIAQLDEEDEDGELVNAEEAEGDPKSAEELPTERKEPPRDQNEPQSESAGSELKSESELVPVESPPATQPASALRRRSKTRRDDQVDSAAAPTPPRTAEQKRTLLAKPGPSGRSKDAPAKCEAAALTGVSSLHSLPPEEIARIALKEVSAAGGDRSLDPAQHHPPPEKHTIQVTADSGGHKHAPISKDAVKATNKAATQQAAAHSISHTHA